MPNPQLSAMPASAAAKRKAAPRDDEGDSDSDSDVVRTSSLLTPHFHAQLLQWLLTPSP